MPLDVPIIPVNVASVAGAAPIREPKDLQGSIDKMMEAFRTGYINTQDIESRRIMGTTEATKKRQENIAGAQKAAGETSTIPDNVAERRLDLIRSRQGLAPTGYQMAPWTPAPDYAAGLPVGAG